MNWGKTRRRRSGTKRMDLTRVRVCVMLMSDSMQAQGAVKEFPGWFMDRLYGDGRRNLKNNCRTVFRPGLIYGQNSEANLYCEKKVLSCHWPSAPLFTTTPFGFQNRSLPFTCYKVQSTRAKEFAGRMMDHPPNEIVMVTQTKTHQRDFWWFSTHFSNSSNFYAYREILNIKLGNALEVDV